MRKINYLVLHCTATQPDATVEAIQRYWKEVMKWKSPGYHYIIEANGKVHNLLPESKPSNGVAGQNANSIHISYIGGVDSKARPKDTRTAAQKAATVELLRDLRGRYPKAQLLGHRDFPNVHKACPSFDVAMWLKEIGMVQHP